jgi:hypothetical protein
MPMTRVLPVFYFRNVLPLCNRSKEPNSRRVTEMITRTATKSPQDYDLEPSSGEAAARTTEGKQDPFTDASSLTVPEHPVKVKGS